MAPHPCHKLLRSHGAAAHLLLQVFERTPDRYATEIMLQDAENKVWFHYLVQVGAGTGGSRHSALQHAAAGAPPPRTLRGTAHSAARVRPTCAHTLLFMACMPSKCAHSLIPTQGPSLV